jgi:hypothetical protein
MGRSAPLMVRSTAAPLDIALIGEGTGRPAPIAGPAGPMGAAGTNGANVLGASTQKPVVRIRCSRKHCRVTGAPHGRAKLVRKSRVYAAGKLPGKLKTRRAVRPGRYTLKVGHERYRVRVG